MRDEAILFLAAASSIMFSAVSSARAKPDLHQYLENSSPAPSMFMTALYRPARTTYAATRRNPVASSYPVADLGLGRPMVSPRMITWNVCSTTTDGSALSIYSRSEKSARSLQGSAIREDVGNHQCADDDGDDEYNGADENPIAGA
jgi:hypothetical protein